MHGRWDAKEETEDLPMYFLIKNAASTENVYTYLYIFQLMYLRYRNAVLKFSNNETWCSGDAQGFLKRRNTKWSSDS
jgi:hypothetical protein